MDGNTAPVSTAAALAGIAREREAWRQLLTDIGEDRMLEIGPEPGKSFKDLVGHINAWDELAMTRLEATVSGEPMPDLGWPDSDDVDEINAWIDARTANRSLAEVLAAKEDHFDRLAAAARTMPLDLLNEPGVFSRAGDRSLGAVLADGSWFFHYHDDHEPAIRNWLAGLDK